MIGGMIMTKDQTIKCNAAIHTASVAAAGVGAGLAQAVGADCVALVPIQVAMIIALGDIFDIPLSNSMAKMVLSQTVATMGGKILAKVLTNLLIGWIPGIGNGVNAAVAAGITESLGWVIAKDFEREAKRKKY